MSASVNNFHKIYIFKVILLGFIFFAQIEFEGVASSVADPDFGNPDSKSVSEKNRIRILKEQNITQKHKKIIPKSNRRVFVKTV